VDQGGAELSNEPLLGASGVEPS